jgi:ABC-2 type transport system permease protein
VELLLTARRGESLLLTLGIPVLLLVFFSLVDVVDVAGAGFENAVDYVAPGILALAVMSTAMVGLGIGAGFERQYGLLRRLGATPLGRPALLAAKTTAVVLIEAVQFAVLVPLALALGWHVRAAGIPLAFAAVVVGTIAFAGLGLLLAGTLRGEVNLAAANGLYVVLLLLGGIVIPLDRLPSAVEAAARWLPSACLATALREALTPGAGISVQPWVALAAWAVVAPLLAARSFRWE